MDGVTSDEDARQASLLVISGVSAGLSMTIGDELFTIGRGRECGMALDGSGISRRHCSIEKDVHGNIVIEDLASTNGTWVEGTKISSQVLSEGDKIRIGPDTVIKFEYQDPLEQTFRQLQYEQAIRDSLTGLHNRRHFLSELRKTLAENLRTRRSASVIKLSIDGYNDINERLGFEAGELVLRRLAKVVRACLGDNDLLARWGEKKFSILLREYDGPLAYEAAERIRNAVKGYSIEWNRARIPVTVSMGIATQAEDDIVEMHELLGETDENLIAAKQKGGDCSVASG